MTGNERIPFESQFKTTEIFKRESAIRKNDILAFSETMNGYFNIVTNDAWQLWNKAKAETVPEKKIYLTCEQLYAAANFGAPNKDPELLETELTIAWFDEAHSGSGYYVYISEYPEEGAMKLESESGAEG
ncbi:MULTISPECIES: hypothetical protein [Acinetobacter]|uniref:Uncharacterized protein n=4 Tax=Acinetobacter baumannii TaxID=470 RepID=A0A0R0XU75_ACIBA|nr:MULTISPECIES: hypothetical protein [Acinetobacter]EHU1211761.1 hypothetical protein [Acinetobacter nosocomialis]EHU1663794.1 hypothetical protein [Acinetobacter baumannii]EHU1782637.1 hypothetical protein [Acinetobacter baumannii]EHU1786518.1 hypothetical protein [Acinetobacter baumannii]EHU1856186.1 hypothetical protein [Acinetobacter baumannii]